MLNWFDIYIFNTYLKWRCFVIYVTSSETKRKLLKTSQYSNFHCFSLFHEIYTVLRTDRLFIILYNLKQQTKISII